MPESIEARVQSGGDISAEFAPFAVPGDIDLPEDTQAYAFVNLYATRQDVMLLSRTPDTTTIELHQVFNADPRPELVPIEAWCRTLEIDHKAGRVALGGTLYQPEDAAVQEHFMQLRLSVIGHEYRPRGLVYPFREAGLQLREQLGLHQKLSVLLRQMVEKP